MVVLCSWTSELLTVIRSRLWLDAIMFCLSCYCHNKDVKCKISNWSVLRVLLVLIGHSYMVKVRWLLLFICKWGVERLMWSDSHWMVVWISFVGYLSVHKEYPSPGFWRETCSSQVLFKWLANQQCEGSFWESCVYQDPENKCTDRR